MSVFVKILGAVFDGIQAPQGGLTQFENDQEKPKITKNMLGLHDNGTLICLVCPAYTPLQGDQWTPTMAWRQVHRWSSASQSLAKDAQRCTVAEECGEVHMTSTEAIGISWV